VALAIEGNTHLTTIGETSQLTAKATFSDGTAKDVSAETKWTSDTTVMQVSPAGLLTVVRYGSTYVSGQYLTKFASVTAYATPPGTFTVVGYVREPGEGYLGGIRVSDVRSGRSTTTGAYGGFTMGELTETARLRVEPDGYERAEVDAPANGPPIDLPIQRIVRVTAGETAQPPRLAPNDMAYKMSSGVQCFPCRLIRVDVPAAGTLHLHLTWSGNTALGLWVNDQMLRGDATATAVDADLASAAGQVVVYAQMINPRPGVHVTFSIDTALAP